LNPPFISIQLDNVTTAHNLQLEGEAALLIPDKVLVLNFNVVKSLNPALGRTFRLQFCAEDEAFISCASSSTHLNTSLSVKV